MEVQSEEKIWYAYETEVFNKLPDLRKHPKIPFRLMKRIKKRWVSMESIFTLLREKEEAAKDRYATGEAYVYSELREVFERELMLSLNANQETKEV